MSFQNDTVSTIELKKTGTGILHAVWQYYIFLILGMFAGGTGVALTIGLAIVIQALLPPVKVFWPNVILFSTVATFLGWASAWLLVKLLTKMASDINNPNGYGIQQILVVSTLVVFVQSLLFL